MDSTAPLDPGGCPRCGTRITQDYKYCPHCAYRLRPDLMQAPPQPVRRGTRAQRLLAIGGYLAFASLLLLVVLAGVRLFGEEEVFLGEAAHSGAARDTHVLPLDIVDGFQHVDGGAVDWGLYLPPRGPTTEAVIDDGFRMGVHEVTNDQYYEFLVAYVRKSGEIAPDHLYPGHWSRWTGNREVRRIYERGRGDHPVTSVSFHAALEFCAWVWEEKFGKDPNLIVDLPTAHEYVRAARGNHAGFNFPWEGSLRRGKANLDGSLKPVNAEACGFYGGFYALVGNAAEWVHGIDDAHTPTAAGWSYQDGHYYGVWENVEADKPTPFSKEGLERIWGGPMRTQVGFRLVVRRAPELPRFLHVTAGRVRLGNPPPHPPAPLNPDNEAVPLAVAFPWTETRVEQDFEISQTEITNRQYLAFLVGQLEPEMEEERLADLFAKYRPESFGRLNPSGDWVAFTGGSSDPNTTSYRDPDFATTEELSKVEPISTVFKGPYGDPRRIPFIYAPGEENHPVQGVTIAQADRYAFWLTGKAAGNGRICRIPTVAEFLRAGRRDGLKPYPWGDDVLDQQLVCSGRRDDRGRAVSLVGRIGAGGDAILGLAGNLLEFVDDPLQDADPDDDSEDARLLLAGGFYGLPASQCTLDSFLDWEWNEVEFRPPDEEPLEFYLDAFTGIRVVRVVKR